MTTVTGAMWDEKENINCCGWTEETHKCRGLFKCPPVRRIIRVTCTNENTHKHMLLLFGNYITTGHSGEEEGDYRHIGGWQAAEGGVCVRSFLLLKLYSCWFLLHWVFNYHWLLCLIQHRCLCWLFFYTPAPSCVSFSACAHSWMHSTHVSTHAQHTRKYKHTQTCRCAKK